MERIIKIEPKNLIEIEEGRKYFIVPFARTIHYTITGGNSDMAKHKGKICFVTYADSSGVFYRFNLRHMRYIWANDCVAGELYKKPEKFVCDDLCQKKVRLKTKRELLKNSQIKIEGDWIITDYMKYNYNIYKLLENALGRIIDCDDINNFYEIKINSTTTIYLTDDFFEVIEKPKETGEKMEVKNLEELKKEMISKVDVEKMKKILSACFKTKGTSLKGIEKILDKWAENKALIYLAFGKKLVLEKDIEFKKEEREIWTEIMELIGKYPYLYWFAVNNYRTMCRNEYEPFSSDFHNKTKIPTNRMKFTKLISLLEENMTPLESLKELSEEEKNIYLKLKEKVKYTSPILDDYSKIISSNKIKGKLKVSIDPIDYILMSHNKSGWDSCYNIAKGGESRHFGEYANGLFSYMQDKHTVISYKHSENLYEFKIGRSKFNEYSRNWRQVIYIDIENKGFITSRQYPNRNDAISENVRNMIEESLSEYYKCENKWTTRKLTNNVGEAQDYFKDDGIGYNDILHDNQLDGAKIVRLKAEKNELHFHTGIPTICPICGYEEVSNQRVPICDNCYSDEED